MNTKYLDRYNKLVNYYKQIVVEGFVEKHHIHPLCMGGTNGKDNLVLLPARAHFLAHCLLHRAYPDNKKLAHAFAMMGVQNPSQCRKVSARLYAQSKEARSQALKGVKLSEETKQKMRKPKRNSENYKKPKSDSHAANISKALKGKKKSPEHILRGVESRKYYQETRKKQTKELHKNYQTLFAVSKLTRKEFAELHNIPYPIMKRYLRCQ